MSFNIKKRKNIKVKSEIKSVETLHSERIKFFEISKEILKNKIKENNCLKLYNELRELEELEMDYFINVKDYCLGDTNSEVYYTAVGISTTHVNRTNIQTAFCIKCNTEKLLTSERYYVCTSCGISDNDRALDGLNYTDECNLNETYIFDYKRINYFIEWLNQIQANESTEIPHEVIEDIKLELGKRNITDTSKLSIPVVKKILKEINHSKYYEHIPLLISRICNSTPLSLPENLIIELKNMFMLIQKPFEKHKNGRKNFLSYPYILYKFFEILNMPEYLVHFTLLKSREKLMRTDILWKNIVDEVYKTTRDQRWIFIPSC